MLMNIFTKFFKIKLHFFFYALLVLASLSGAFFYMIYQEKIMIIFPNAQNSKNTLQNQNHINTGGDIKNSTAIITLYLPNTLDGTYSTEKTTITTTGSAQDNHTAVISAWINAQINIPKKTALQNVALSPSQKDVFIHFAGKANLFDPQASTHDKLLLVQALLKTLHAYNNKIEYVYFLANKKPLNDYELDFSKGWPIKGFV